MYFHELWYPFGFHLNITRRRIPHTIFIQTYGLICYRRYRTKWQDVPLQLLWMYYCIVLLFFALHKTCAPTCASRAREGIRSTRRNCGGSDKQFISYRDDRDCMIIFIHWNILTNCARHTCSSRRFQGRVPIKKNSIILFFFSDNFIPLRYWKEIAMQEFIWFQLYFWHIQFQHLFYSVAMQKNTGRRDNRSKKEKGMHSFAITVSSTQPLNDSSTNIS